MGRVLFIGDINVDVIMGGMASPPVLDREVPCKTFDVVMGASTVLCACAYASLGGEAWFAGLAGEDDYGEFMVRGLAGFGIRTDLIRRTRAVRTGVTVNLIHENTRTQVTYPGTIEEFDAEGLNESVLRQFDHIHFGGVCLEQKLKPRIPGLLRSARELGLTSSLDPQWESTEVWDYLDPCYPLLSWLFVNSDEAMSITGAPSAENACRALAGRTASPLVKIGKEGALAWDGEEVRRVPSRPVEAVDTTGAGDSFDAGFLYATLEKKMPLLKAVEFANAVAARSCLFIGGTTARTSYDAAAAFMSGDVSPRSGR